HNVPGNHFDKHGSRNPIVKVLMARFHEAVVREVVELEATSLLDVGCGEGRTTRVLATCVENLVGVELESHLLREARAHVPSARFVGGSIYSLPFADRSFDAVIATEVLEHVDDPQSALVEVSRVARHAIIVTVPHEPWWRIAN